MLLLLGAQRTHWQAASLPAHELRVREFLQAHSARIQGVLLVGRQSDQERAVLKDDLAPLEAPSGHHSASGYLRHADLPCGILVLEWRQVKVQQLRGSFRADHLGSLGVSRSYSNFSKHATSESHGHETLEQKSTEFSKGLRYPFKDLSDHLCMQFYRSDQKCIVNTLDASQYSSILESMNSLESA